MMQQIKLFNSMKYLCKIIKILIRYGRNLLYAEKRVAEDQKLKSNFLLYNIKRF